MKRVSRACQQCRSKHIKCNGRSPCSRCIAHAELHNISPTEICLYPEPKKRGRPSAGTSGHHSHHSSHTSSSVAKKKLNSTNRVKVLSASASPSSVSSITRRQTSSANTSPTPNVINLQQQQQQPSQTRWQKTSIATQPESVVYWNANEAVQVPSYVLPQQISLNSGQMPITMADLVSQHLNFNFISNYDYGYLNQGQQQQQQQQPQQRVIALNAANASLPSHTSTFIPQNSIISSNNANSCYRQAYPNNNNSNSNGTRASSNNNNNNNNNDNSNRDNSYHNSPNSHHYHLNRPYHAHLNYSATLSNSNSQMNANSNYHFSDSMYSNNSNFSNEGSISDSSDSPDSSLTSTPELLPTLSTNTPSITNSPVLNLADYNPYLYGVNTNALNIGHVEPLLHEYISYQQESELDSPLLSDAKSEIAYVSSIAPYSSSNCIYPSLLERNNTSSYVKTEDSRSFYESIPVNPAGWLY